MSGLKLLLVDLLQQMMVEEGKIERVISEIMKYYNDLFMRARETN